MGGTVTLAKSARGTRCLVFCFAAIFLLKGPLLDFVPGSRSSLDQRLVDQSRTLSPAKLSPQLPQDVPIVARSSLATASFGTVSNPLVGYVACLLACLSFGSCNIPVKGTNVRDGMFFTLWKAIGVLAVGVIQWLLAGRYKFEPFAMLGGVLWAIGNLFVPYVMQRCGLGAGQLIYGVTSMLLGWACGTFGLFGKTVDVIGNPTMNYIGVVIAVLSLAVFPLMKNDTGKVETKSGAEISNAKSKQEFIRGFAAAVIVGFFIGLNFNPPTYLTQLGQLDKAAGLPPSLWSHSINPADYVISHFCGIVATTAMVFLAYCMVTPKPFYGKEVVLPGIVSGLMWGVAQMAWFTANGVLSFVVAFPIIKAVPGVISALWGVLLFGENSGRRNLSLLSVVVALQAAGVALIAMSKG